MSIRASISAGLAVTAVVALMAFTLITNTGCNLDQVIGTNSPSITNVPPIETNTPPVVTNVPPVTNPVPATAFYKGTMFYPHKLQGTTTTPPWPGNSGVVEWWSDGVVEWWSGGVIEWTVLGLME